MALLLAATSPALAVRGRGRAKDLRGQKRRKNCRIQSSSSRDVDELLDEVLWKTLPEDIVDLILERLPFAAKRRARCLCRRWKEIRILSPPPPVTVTSREGDQNAVFWCDAERKWSSLPSNRHVPSGQTWEMVDADAGLICYQCNIDGWFWLWVCNPLKPSLSRLIQPSLARRDSNIWTPRAPQSKLLVDRARGTYKIITMADRLCCTSVYKSTTSRWAIHETGPNMSLLDLFVWNNIFYAYSTEKDYLKKGFCLLATFDLQRRWWNRIPVKIPSEVDFPTNRFFLTNNKELMLVLYSCTKLYQPYFSVWKLIHDGYTSASAPFCKLENWQKVELGSVREVADLRRHRLARASFGGEHICFVFTDDKMTPKIVRYSLTGKSWSQMSCGKDQGGSFRLHNWEPNLDIGPS